MTLFGRVKAKKPIKSSSKIKSSTQFAAPPTVLSNSNASPAPNTTSSPPKLMICPYGYRVNDIFATMTPHILKKYNLKIMDDTVHHRDCKFINYDDICKKTFTPKLKSEILNKMHIDGQRQRFDLLSRNQIISRCQNYSRQINEFKLK